MSKLVILGGSGFVGRSLLNKLGKEEYDSKVIIYKNDIKTNFKKFRGDILVPEVLDNQIENGDTIVNLIGQFYESDSNFIDLNILGALNILNSCIKKKKIRIILISSINVYGENLGKPSKETDPSQPITNYGIVKLITERIYQHYSKLYHMDVTVLRLSNLYGPQKKSGPVANLINSLNNGKNIFAYNKGRQLRDFLFIEDATEGIIQAIKIPQKGYNVFNLSTGKRHMVKDVIKIIEKMTGKKLRVRLDPRIPDERCIWADNSKAKKILKFSPKTILQQGIEITVNNYIDTYNKKVRHYD